MKTIHVEVRPDHIQVLAQAKPLAALAELIWNAWDAEAERVEVRFEENDLGGVERLVVSDDGRGLPYEDALVAFRNLGDSWKREGEYTGEQRRALHGQYGRGRFRAFSLGNRVEWRVVYGDESGRLWSYRIAGRAEQPGTFEVSPPEAAGAANTGVTVVIEDVVSNIGLLRGQKPFQDVTDIFATYLRDYPGLRLVYDGTPVDPRNAEETSATYGLGELVLENGEVITAELAIVEWELPGKRGIMFCDEHGYVLAPARAKPYFRGFSYTAYLNSAHFRRLEQEGLLDVPEMAPDVRRLTEEAKRLLRRHFAAREDARGGDVLTRWKESGLYPYDGPPRNTAERKERRIFDIYAAHLAHAPGVKDAPAESQRMALRLLRELVRAEPVGAARALDAVLTLPEADRQELAALSGG